MWVIQRGWTDRLGEKLFIGLCVVGWNFCRRRADEALLSVNAEVSVCQEPQDT